MTNLKTTDVFKAFRLVKASNLRAELIPVIQKAAEAEKFSIEELGIDFFLTIFEALSERGAESSFYDLLSGPFEMDAEEIANLDADKFVEMLGELGKVSNIPAFFNALSGLITLKSLT